VRIIRAGDVGEDVRDVQQRLVALGMALDPDETARFGPTTEAAVRAFQADRRLPSDGLVGPDTWAELVEAGYALGDRALYLRHPLIRGDDVRALQRRLNALGFDAGREDGILGRETDHAIREFQRNVGHDIDGIVGPQAIQALSRLRPDEARPSRAVVREREELRGPRPSAPGVIAIDPGHGGDDRGVLGARGLAEADAAWTIAQHLCRELERRRLVTLMLRARTSNPPPSERVAAANEAAAAAFVSIHLGSESADEPGAACAYFGTSSTHSPAGQSLAELLQARMCVRLGLKDLGCSPLAIAVLRETKMPAVLVEPGRLAMPEDERRLMGDAFLEALAVAIADGLEEFLAPGGTAAVRAGRGGAGRAGAGRAGRG
jgi:N-acetylmuramoyl-L-alanine amidase